MALIAMAIYSTEENGKDKYLRETLEWLRPGFGGKTYPHRFMVSVNAATPETERLIDHYTKRNLISYVHRNDTNVGTAAAINEIWKFRSPEENCVKMDDDVVIRGNKPLHWVDKLEYTIHKDPNIGIIGLKRKDCWENPEHPDPFYRSTLKYLPHEPGEQWITIEEVNHVMGTCQMYSSALLDKIGYLFQPSLYGFDDSLAAIRCQKAGFYNCFYPSIEIDHIDPGGTLYQDWKEKHAGEQWEEFTKYKNGYKSGEIDIYYNPFK